MNPRKDTITGSGTRHGAAAVVVAQIIGRVLTHNGVLGVTPGDVLIGAELLVDGLSLAAGALAFVGGAVWRRFGIRTGPA